MGTSCQDFPPFFPALCELCGVGEQVFVVLGFDFYIDGYLWGSLQHFTLVVQGERV